MSQATYIVYRTTNNVNQKTYIGTHKQVGTDPYSFDGYLGSGIALNAAVRRDGKENFTRETLFVFDNRSDCMAKERELVDESVVSDKNNYNLKEGGEGGWDFVNINQLTYKRTKETEAKRRQTFIDRYGVDNAGKMDKSLQGLIARNKRGLSEESHQKRSRTMKERGSNAGVNNPMYGRSGELAPCYGRTGDKHPMYGKNQTEEAKAKIRASANRNPKPIVTCPHCGKTGGKPVMSQWHMDKCKYRKLS